MSCTSPKTVAPSPLGVALKQSQPELSSPHLFLTASKLSRFLLLSPVTPLVPCSYRLVPPSSLFFSWRPARKNAKKAHGNGVAGGELKFSSRRARRVSTWRAKSSRAKSSRREKSSHRRCARSSSTCGRSGLMVTRGTRSLGGKEWSFRKIEKKQLEEAPKKITSDFLSFSAGSRVFLVFLATRAVGAADLTGRRVV